MISTSGVNRLSGDEMVACFPHDYERLLDDKVSKFQSLLSSINCPHNNSEIERFESPRQNYRMRANFNIYRDFLSSDEPNNIYYCMYNESKQPVEIINFPRGSLLLNKIMNDLMIAIRIEDNLILRQKLFEVRFLTTSIHESAIILLYKRQLSNVWIEKAKILSLAFNSKIIGRARRQKIVIYKGQHINIHSLSTSNQDDNNNNDDDDDNNDDDVEIPNKARNEDLAEMIKEELTIFDKKCK